MNRLGILYAESSCLSSWRSADSSIVVLGGDDRGHRLSALGVGDAEDVAAEPPLTSAIAFSTSAGETLAPAVLIIEPRRPMK